MPIKDQRTISDLQRRLLRLLGTGATDAEIAGQLYVSESTVRRNLAVIAVIFGERKRPALVAEAYRRGYIRA